MERKKFTYYNFKLCLWDIGLRYSIILQKKQEGM